MHVHTCVIVCACVCTYMCDSMCMCAHVCNNEREVTACIERSILCKDINTIMYSFMDHHRTNDHPPSISYIPWEWCLLLDCTRAASQWSWGWTCHVTEYQCRLGALQTHPLWHRHAVQGTAPTPDWRSHLQWGRRRRVKVVVSVLLKLLWVVVTI